MARLTPDTAATLLPGRTKQDATNASVPSESIVIIDATDDPSVRFLVNDWAVTHGVDAVLGGVSGFIGQVVAIAGGCGPCFRCLFETVPEPGEVGSCALDGVIGALAGVVGFVQAERALALLNGDRAGQTGFITTFDGLTGRIRHLPLPVGAACAGCGGLSARHRVADVDAGLAALAACQAGTLVDLVGAVDVINELALALTVRGAPPIIVGPADNLLRLVVRAPAGSETTQPTQTKKGHALWQ